MQRRTFFLSVALGLLLLALCYTTRTTPAALAENDVPALTATPSPITDPTETATATPTPTSTPTATPTATPPLGRPLTCADMPSGTHCIILQVVKLARDVGTLWTVHNPTTEMVWISERYQDITGTTVLTGLIGIYPGSTTNYYVNEERTLPVGFLGTLLLTSTGEFNAWVSGQNVQCSPSERERTNCMVLEGLLGSSVVTPTEQLSRYYSVFNPNVGPAEIVNQIYIHGIWYLTFTELFKGGETKTYDMVELLKLRNPGLALMLFPFPSSEGSGAVKLLSASGFGANVGRGTPWVSPVWLPVVSKQ